VLVLLHSDDQDLMEAWDHGGICYDRVSRDTSSLAVISAVRETGLERGLVRDTHADSLMC